MNDCCNFPGRPSVTANASFGVACSWGRLGSWTSCKNSREAATAARQLTSCSPATCCALEKFCPTEPSTAIASCGRMSPFARASSAALVSRTGFAHDVQHDIRTVSPPAVTTSSPLPRRAQRHPVNATSDSIRAPDIHLMEWRESCAPESATYSRWLDRSPVT
jgi:hypothetical protein